MISHIPLLTCLVSACTQQFLGGFQLGWSMQIPARRHITCTNNYLLLFCDRKLYHQSNLASRLTDWVSDCHSRLCQDLRPLTRCYQPTILLPPSKWQDQGCDFCLHWWKQVCTCIFILFIAKVLKKYNCCYISPLHKNVKKAHHKSVHISVV